MQYLDLLFNVMGNNSGEKTMKDNKMLRGIELKTRTDGVVGGVNIY